MVVRISPSASSRILNERYAAWSAEAPTAIAGAPISTTAGYRYSIPVVLNGP
jgi:hypothetical protein